MVWSILSLVPCFFREMTEIWRAYELGKIIWACGFNSNNGDSFWVWGHRENKFLDAEFGWRGKTSAEDSNDGS